MAHLQYMPGDPRLVDQLVCELKSKGIFDQFRKECIADVDTRPAYQNLRQRVESSVATFLARQTWKPDLNKNQLREKLRKHLLDGNYLEQGVERIVDQVVNPKVASVFIPQVEDLVYNYLGIPRKKAVPDPETSNGKAENLLPTDLEAVSPGSVKSNDVDDRSEAMDTSDSKEEKMEIDEEKTKDETKDDSVIFDSVVKEKEESRLSGISELTIHDSDISIDKNTITIPLPAEEIKLENIPAPENSPPNIKNKNIDLEKIDLPREPNLSTDIPLPDEIPKVEGDAYFKPITNSEEDDSSSDSSLRRNMSPLTPIRNYNNENSCDAQQAFENDSDGKTDDKTEPSSFRFTIEAKSDNSNDVTKKEEKKEESVNIYQLNPQVNTQINTQVNTQINTQVNTQINTQINTQVNTQVNTTTVNFNTPLYDDSSNSNNLQIDYESDANSKAADIKVPEVDQSSKDSLKKEKKEESKSNHKSSHRSRDSHRHSSSKDKRSTSTSKHSSSRDSSRHDKKSKDDKSKSSHKEKASDRGDKNEKKDSRDSSKHRSSSSHKSSSHRDSKDSKHRSSSSKHSSSSKDDKKSSSSSSSQRDKEKTSSSSRDKDKPKDSKSSSRDKDKKSSSSSKKSDEKENKERKEKKDADDHYSLSGRGNPNRRSTDRDSNDGSSSSKGSHKPSNSKSGENKKESKGSSKSENHSSSGDSPSPSDSVETNKAKNISQSKPVIRVDTHLENHVSTPPRLPFVPDVTIKKPRFAANLQEAKQMIKMRKFLEEEQKRMNQEAALLLEFQANVRPSLSQVYSSIPGPELEFACVSNTVQPVQSQIVVMEEETPVKKELVAMETVKVEIKKEEVEDEEDKKSEAKIEIQGKLDIISETLTAMHHDGENEDKANDSKKSDNKQNIKVELIVEDKVPVLETLSNKVEIKEPSLHTEIIKEIGIEAIKNTELKDEKSPEYFEVTIITEELSETDEPKSLSPETELKDKPVDEKLLKYFAEHEKFDAEIERDKFSTFLKKFTESLSKKKIYLINCETYEENLIKEVSETFGQLEIVNFVKNGCIKARKNIVKNVNLTAEITLPTKVDTFERSVTPDRSVMFSPAKSECSFELSSDYDAKLEEMVNRTSRQEIMEIILGSAIEESPSEVELDYTITKEANIEENCLKRKISEVESTENNNRRVLTPNKLRKMSCSDQISSTTGESKLVTANRVQVAKSKYLGKARRVGLPKPRRANLPNSPSSDKSVENYEQNETPNGKMKSTPRSKVQRYDTSDLYKPKLHYLSRRNNIS